MGLVPVFTLEPNNKCLPKFVQGPLVQKLININPRQFNSLWRSLIPYSQMLFKADIRQNFILEEVNLEKQKMSKRNFNQKVKSMQ